MGKLKSPIIFILLFFIVLPLAYSINPVGLPKFSYDASNGIASVTFTIESTLSSESGVFELQMSTSNLQSIFPNPTACDSVKPWQTAQPYQFTQIGEQKSIILVDNNIPDGTYYPLLVHVDTCCTTGSCKAQQPFGWGYPLSTSITFKRQSTTPPPTATPPPTLKLSNLKRITNFDQFSALDKTWIYLVNAPVYAVTITNIGTQSAKGTVEAYYVSKENNPFFTNKLTELSNRNSLSPLQSVALIKGGETCKKDIGFSYDFGTLLAYESKTIYMQPTKPVSCDNDPVKCKLDEKNNYNSNDEYLLIVNAIDDCTNGNSFDEIGGCINFGICDKISDSDAHNTPKDINARQSTVKREDVSKKTSQELQKSLCTDSVQCKSDAECQNLQSLKENNFLTNGEVEKRLEDHSQLISSGGAAGILTALSFAGKLCPTTIGVSGYGMPICLGLIALSGEILGNSLTSFKFSDLFNAIKSKDPTKEGYCVPKEETIDIGIFKDITSSVGKSVNNFFGTRNKITDFTLGIIVIGFLAYLFFFRNK